MASTDIPEVGQEIPAFVRETGLENWNRYAAVNDEFVGIHMDDVAGQAAGYPTAFGMGNLQWSYLHNLVREWGGERGKIERMSCQFRGPNVKGQTVTARGRVSAVRPGPERTEVDLEVWTTDQDGNQLAPGNATVSFPTAG
jgi:acyl dehydratase